MLASEFCGTSISSRAGTTQDKVDAIARHNPHVLLARCEERGYGLADITPTRWTTTLRVLDDPLRPRGLRSRPFDGEGMAGARRAIVEDGVLTTWMLDSTAGRQLGLASTGHAARGTGGPPSPARSCTVPRS